MNNVEFLIQEYFRSVEQNEHWLETVWLKWILSISWLYKELKSENPQKWNYLRKHLIFTLHKNGLVSLTLLRIYHSYCLSWVSPTEMFSVVFSSVKLMLYKHKVFLLNKLNCSWEKIEYVPTYLCILMSRFLFVFFSEENIVIFNWNQK